MAALKSCAVSESTLYTSVPNSTFRAFRYKLIANLLPLGCRSKLWGALNNPLGKCFRCHCENEDIAHLFECAAARAARESFPNRLKEVLSSVWKGNEQASPGVAADWFISQGLTISLFRGALNDFFADLVKSLPTCYPFELTSLSLLRALWIVAYEDFWKPRYNRA